MENNSQYFDCLCRTCMNKVEESSHDGTNKPQPQWLSIFDTIEECGEVRIAELLSDAVPQIAVWPSDELPKKICTECLQRLLSANRFQQMCIQSDKQMHNLLSKEQTILRTPKLEEAIKGETGGNDADSEPLQDLPNSNTLQNLQQPSIQESLAEVTAQTNEPEAAQSSAVDHLQDDNQLLEQCIDAQSEFEEFIKNEPIEDDEANSEYSDGDTMHSTISVTKDEVLPIEFEDQQVNDASSRHNCHLCNKSYKLRNSLRRHLKDHKKKADNRKEYCYACHLCGESYKEQRYLSTHLSLEHHNRSSHTQKSSSRHDCHLCNKSYKRREYLRKHLRDHKKKANNRREYCYACHLGGESYKEQRYLLRHLRLEHHNRSSHTQKSSILAEKRTTHAEDRPYECQYCPLRFSSKMYATRHQRTHEGSKRHECNICGKKFPVKCSLTRHKRVHSKEKPHKCDQCEKRFAQMNQLKIHILTHTGEKPFKCKYCESGFAASSLLSRHLRTHLGKNIHRCKFCPLAFHLAADMRLHLTSHKNEDPEVRERNLKSLQEEEAKLVLKFSKERAERQSKEKQQQPKLSNKEIEQQASDSILAEKRATHAEDKPYECPYCPLRFSSTSEVSIHKTIHEGIKPHKCNICGKKFRLNCSLTRHKQIHTKEKPHKCDVCEKRFALMQQLKIHIRTHTGEKPFKCKYCQRGFATSTALFKHLRRHLGNNIHTCKFCPLAFPSSTEMRLHLTSHKNEDSEVRERNLKALQEHEAKLKLKFSKEISNGQSTDEQQQQKLSTKEIKQSSTERDEFGEFIKNEPNKFDKQNRDYSDGNIMYSTISGAKDVALPIEPDDQQVNETRDEFGAFVINEPIEDDNRNTEYRDGDKMHSIISVMKDEPTEPEDEQVNDAPDEFREFTKNESIEDDKSKTEYSSGNTMHSTMTEKKNEASAIEPEA